MLLYLVQHAEAKKEEEDPERGLTAKGLLDIRRTSAYAARMGIKTEEIIHSGKKRAVETATVLAEALKPPQGVSISGGLSPTDDPAIWAGRLSGVSHDIMLVGHLPHLSKLSSLLLANDTARTVVSFEMASIVCLRRDDSAWSVKWMITPVMVP